MSRTIDETDEIVAIERAARQFQLREWRRRCACADRMCGADDCPTCHPELLMAEEESEE